MTNEALLDYAARRGHTVTFAPLTDNPSFCIDSDSGGYIFVSSRLSQNDKKIKTAHELGHCEYGGFYNRHSRFDIRAKAERRADKWSYTKLMPLRDVKIACRQGMTEAWQIAEHFDVTCEYAAQAVSYYHSLGLI